MNKTWKTILKVISYVLVASIFGLDYYVKLITKKIDGNVRIGYYK